MPVAPADKPEAAKPEAAPVDPAVAETDALVQGKPAAELVPLLGHARFRVRQAAQAALANLLEQDPGNVEKICYEAYANQADPEIRMRAREILVGHVAGARGARGRGFVGVGLILHADFDPAGNMMFGVKITQVIAGMPGAKAGLQLGDVIVGVDDTPLRDPDADQRFMDIVSNKGPGKAIMLKFERDGQAREAEIILARRPTDLEDSNPVDPEKLFQEYLAEKRKN